MMDDIIITTTNSIEGAEVEHYFGVVSTNVVIGTNFFSDLSASITDFFGGYSDSYQNKLQMIYKDAMKNLSDKAHILGGNAILGLKVDFDEVSGKSKSMFMVSAMGTAVKIKMKDCLCDKVTKERIMITASDFTYEFKKHQYLKYLSNGDKELNSKDWDYLSSHYMPEIVPLLYPKFQKAYSTAYSLSDEDTLLADKYPSLIGHLSYDEAIEIVYNDIEQYQSAGLKLITDYKLFSASKIIEVLDKGAIDLVIKLLNTDKQCYTKEDIISMENLLNRLHSLPEKGRIESIKGFLTKASDKYICPEGHTNSLEKKYCSVCGKNIYGLFEQEMDAIELYADKIEVLKGIFK